MVTLTALCHRSLILKCTLTPLTFLYFFLFLSLTHCRFFFSRRTVHLEDTLDPDGTPRWTPNRGNNTIEYVDMSYTVALESSRGAAKVNLEVHLYTYTLIHFTYAHIHKIYIYTCKHTYSSTLSHAHTHKHTFILTHSCLNITIIS